MRQGNIVSRVFIYSVLLLLVAAISAKIMTFINAPRLLQYENPVLRLPERTVIVISVVLEVAVIVGVMRISSHRTKALVILWMCALFAAYRVLASMSPLPPQMCPCLGRLEWLGIPDHFADSLAKALLIYMAVGAFLVVLYTRNRRRPGPEA
jgi:hypothetical protein